MIHEEVKFNISQLDSLGQGVSKNGRVIFIEKVLPGESGTGIVYREAKGVRFAVLKSLEKQSPLRKKPVCSMFESCYGCQYLHLSYEDELNFKYLILQKQFEKLLKKDQSIDIYPSIKRYGYRNRVQLHYDKKNRKLGYISKTTTEIIQADKCLLPLESISKEIKKLYDKDSWADRLPEKSPDKGTIELYSKNGDISINFNRPYSNGEFSQINEDMNEILKGVVEKTYSENVKGTGTPVILDVFGGGGNLTSGLYGARVVVLDIQPGRPESPDGKNPVNFVSENLYGKNAVLKCKKKLQKLNVPMPNLIVFDPPRKGVKNINEWVDKFYPEFIFYVSCNSATLKRDTKAIEEKYELSNISLIDLFPGTKHFETFAVFKKIN